MAPPSPHSPPSSPCIFPPPLSTGWTFNFVFANVLFWVYGFTALLDNGYTDNKDERAQKGLGAIISGPSGSGVGIITTMLFVVGTLQFFKKFMRYEPEAV